MLSCPVQPLLLLPSLLLCDGLMLLLLLPLQKCFVALIETGFSSQANIWQYTYCRNELVKQRSGHPYGTYWTDSVALSIFGLVPSSCFEDFSIEIAHEKLKILKRVFVIWIASTSQIISINWRSIRSSPSIEYWIQGEIDKRDNSELGKKFNLLPITRKHLKSRKRDGTSASTAQMLNESLVWIVSHIARKSYLFPTGQSDSEWSSVDCSHIPI